MTIHRAKGLEFPVVCVADLGRKAGGTRSPLLVGADGTAGLRLAPLGGGDTIPTTAWTALADEDAEADAEEERRLFYVAMTRAKELLILSGGTDVGQLAVRRAPAARRSTGSPARSSACRKWCSAAPRRTIPSSSCATGTAARRASSRGSTRPRRSARSCPKRALAAAAARPRRPEHDRAARQARLRPARARAGAAGAAAAQLLAAHRLRQVRLPLLPASACSGCPTSTPPPPEVEPEVVAGIDPRTRGSIVHRALEEIDFDAPRRRPTDVDPGLRRRRRRHAHRRRGRGRSRPSSQAFADSPLCERLTRATNVTREAWFAFALEPDGGGPLVRGIVDVYARRARRHAPGRRLQDRPRPRGHDPARLHRPQLRDAAARLRARRAAGRRARGRGRLLPARAPRRAGHDASTRAQDAPELADALAAARPRPAHPPLRGHADTPHRELCGDCPGRHALCSHPQSVTLRPPPAPWPGAPVRHTSPAGASLAAGPPPR